jgi:D-alanyl-D-alanine carboxypeptidase
MLKLFAYINLIILLFMPIWAYAQTPTVINNRYADIVIEPDSGRILHATNADSIRHPASLTKMMTLYLTFMALKDGRLKLDQQLPVSNRAAAQSPTKLGLKAGQMISVRNAIMSMVTLSANDSAVVLAEALAGSEADFGRLMTEQAAQLGMKQTHFNNASGLPDPTQTTTAYDMAMLGMALFRNFPQYYSFFSVKSFDYGNSHYHNHNHLMERYPGMDGIKTGYIQSSGFNLVASAKQGGIRLIGVVFGGSSPVTRDQRMAQLLNEAFINLFSLNRSPVNINAAQKKSG